MFSPEGEVRAVALLIHGQGDFGSRYDAVASVFCERGIAVYAVDLPGHGLTAGERGDIPSMAVAEEFVGHAYSQLAREFPERPIGLLAHSMGGQLALRELLINSREYAFCWMNGPLLYPAKRKHPFEIFLLRLLAKVIPRYTISTQVKRSECQPVDASWVKKNDPLFHSSISLRWGLALIRSAEEVAALAKSVQIQIPILVTQGELDTVNPTKYANEFFVDLPWESLDYQLIPQALHEPFQHDNPEEFYEILSSWCDEVA